MRQGLTLITPHSVPSGWDAIRFTDAFTDRTGGQRKVKKGEYLASGALRVVDQGRESIGGFTNDLGARCRVPLPCLLFGDHTRLVKYEDSPFALGADGVKVLEPRDDINARFAFHYLRALPLPEDAGYSRHFRFLKRTWFPLPSLPEQSRIAAILDKADAVRRKRQQTLDLADQFVRSAFLDMFGDPVTNPKGWPVKKLEDLIDQARGISYGIVQRGTDTGGGVPVVRISNIATNSFVSTPIVRTEEAVASKYLRTFLKGGELLVSIRGTVGRVAIAPSAAKGWNVSREIAVVPVEADMSLDYLHHALLTDAAQHFMLDEVRGIAQRGINLRDLRDLPIPMPEQSELDKWDNLLHSWDSMCCVEERHSAELENLAGVLAERGFRGEF